MTNKKNLIITIIFLAISFVVGGITVKNNYREILSSIYNTYKNSDENLNDKLALTFDQTIKSFNSTFNKNLFGLQYFIEGYGTTQKLLNKKLINDADIGYMLKDEQGYLHFAGYNYNTKANAAKLALMNDYFKDINIPFSFVMALSKDYEGITTFKKGIDIYANSNQNCDNFIKGLEENDISYLDLRESTKKGDLDIENSFFKTDHHWKTETAFWAFKELVNYIDDSYGIKLDQNNYYTDIANYKIKTLENSFLGSLGKRMGRIYSGIDDYTLITPDFETNIKLYNGFGKTLQSEGSFDDTIIDKTLSSPDMPADTNRYAAYFSLDSDFNTIINENAQNDYKILIIKDSYALPVAAFLSLTCKEVTMIDFRLSKEQSVKEFINNNDYDLILMMYGSGSICNDDMFDLK